MSAETKGPTDWSDWEEYRDQVTHPAAAIKPLDLQRAKENIRRFGWAQRYLSSLRKSADHIVKQVSGDYLERMIEPTTPGCVGPCPACRAKGIPWHPNGQWSWSSSNPDKIKCRACGTVFPNDEYPENILIECKWGRGQKFTFIGGETFRCFGYRYARPSISGIIRARKVSHVTGQLHTLAAAYALTETPRYARAAKDILLRFAEVFPEYLVRAGYGYGEYAGMDPHAAAERISDLPEDELVYPPNKPNRKIYAGYWAASRIGSSGMDGWWVVRVAESYDLTCTAQENGIPVYSRDERIRIERDVLLESTYLAACDPSINNKSVGNRAGAAIVGMCVGHPGLVRFGLDGFRRAVEGWFLPDGGTSESPAYAMMTMSGIRPFALAFRDYSDPPGYVASDGKRLDGFDACRDTRYGDCWQGLIWTLQGDLRFPPSADSYRTSAIGASFAELIAVAYPTDEHIALLKEIAGDDLASGAVSDAIFYREPRLESRQTPPLSLPDIVFPFLSQGYLRTGGAGRQSLAMLNASDYGGHHHLDSLNLYYWKDGHELLSDLGYLWDHPHSYQTRRTFAHNLVMIDGRDQRTRGRGGNFHLFSVTPRVKAMEASSSAYGTESAYRRTCVLVNQGPADSYLLDIFRVSGGQKREYIFHGPNNDYEVKGLQLASEVQPERRAPFAVRFHLPVLGEIFVDDIEIREVVEDEESGPNLAPNPSAVKAGAEQTPRGWGCYIGDGKAEWGFGSPGHTDASSARIKATAPHANGRVNVALLCGESNGYTGPNAIQGKLGATYKMRFAICGAAEVVNVGFVTWPSNPNSPADRRHGAIDLSGVTKLSATHEWKNYEGTFTLPSDSADMADAQQARGENPWSIVWAFKDGYTFQAFAPGSARELVIVGDGWGQRDHRNTDVGATLPYIIRRVEGNEGIDTFVSVFAGNRKGQELVKSVRVIPLPTDAPANAIALAVDTSEGVDIIVSMLTPATITLPSEIGEISTDGRLTAILAARGKASSACLVGGTRLAAPGPDIKLPAPALRGNILSVGSERGVSYFDVDGDMPTGQELVGQTFFAIDDDFSRAYPIRGVEKIGDRLRCFTKRDGRGFEARPAKRWEIPVTAIWSADDQN